MKEGIIFGAGKVGRKVYVPLTLKYNIKVIAYVDNSISLQGNMLYDVPIISCGEIAKLCYDLIFIALYDLDQINEVRQQLAQQGVANEKIVVLATDLSYMQVFMDQRFVWIKGYADWIYGMGGGGGNVAECGVFRGDSAKFLNAFFPDKKLFLFDTFEGFSAQDKKEESIINKYFVTSEYNSDTIFANTSIDFVMKKMINPQNVIIKQGYFPKSAEGINDTFCFVNLDMDLFVPMLNGLRFFWEKLEAFGCILLHDYFVRNLLGVKAAVEAFEKERGIVIPKTPIGDGSSIALLKY